MAGPSRHAPSAIHQIPCDLSRPVERSDAQAKVSSGVPSFWRYDVLVPLRSGVLGLLRSDVLVLLRLGVWAFQKPGVTTSIHWGPSATD